MTMSMVHQRYRRSYSLDSGLDSFQRQSWELFGLTAQQPFSIGDIWDTYFDGGILAYQGLDEEWIDGSISGSEACITMELPVDQESYKHLQQDQQNHLAAMRTPISQDTGEQPLARGPLESQVGGVEGILESRVS